MKMAEALALLNLDKYQEILSLISDDASGLVIRHGSEVLQVTDNGEKILQASELPLDECVSQKVWLQDYQYQPFAELLLITAEEAERHIKEESVFSSIARCVQDELTAATELLEMTDELTGRYEELNLVFSDQESDELPSGIDRELKEIVDNSNQYLKLSLCFMGLGSQGLTFLSASTEELQSYEAVLPALLTPVIKLLEEHPGSHVFNDGLEYTLPVTKAYRKWRHIVTPITIGSSGNVAGFLLVARPPDQPFFTNSDKNLLEVMAQKASKLIRGTYDDLTRLLRRSSFQNQLESALADPSADKTGLAVLQVNVDRMQVINEAHGHDVGNELLRWIARKLEDSCQTNEIVGRLGGDKFGLLLHRISSVEAESAAKRIVAMFADQQFHWNGAVVEVSVSAGLALIQQETRHALQPLAEAEFACTAAKEFGGGRLEIFTAGDAILIERHAQLNQVTVIQNALRENAFVLYAQPIHPLVDKNREPHAEILIRLKGDDGKIVPPGLFLPAAEKFNLMPTVDKWVVEHAFKTIEQHSRAINDAALVLTINLSGQALSDSGFVFFLKNCLERYAPKPGSICFEVTETTAIRDMRLAQELMTDLRSRGVSFALDDFGTGLSSFSYLQQLPLDILKIDGSFVREIVHDDVAHTMVRAINDVGQSMGLVTIAEFVSSDEIAAELVKMGVDYGQGYSLAEPIPLENYLDSLSSSVPSSDQSKTA